MSESTNPLLADQFDLFGSTKVQILQGDILKAAKEKAVEVVVSTDDNYLTMASGVSAVLREQAAPSKESDAYIREAQAQCPVKASTVVVTGPHELNRPDCLPNVKKVFHGTVVDYDTEDLPLEDLVYQTTLNCLTEAERLGLKSILFPAFGTGAGMLSMATCAQEMCRAIKAYLAHERPLESVYIILYLPEGAEAEVAEFADQNTSFLVEANLVLGIPFDPSLNQRQTRDFYGASRRAALERVGDMISDKLPGKRNVVILGGPQIGKWTLLDQLYEGAQREAEESPDRLYHGRRVVKVRFGRVHENTSASFVYRKFLSALLEDETEEDVKAEIKKIYADPEMGGDDFLGFLDEHRQRYPKIVFLVDHLPKLLDMEGEGAGRYEDVRAFWKGIDQLEGRVQFVYSARNDAQFENLLDRLSGRFKDGLEEIRLTCISDEDRTEWVNGLYDRFLGRNATPAELEFFAAEAGFHPYLISLAGHALIEAIKSDFIRNPGSHPRGYNRTSLEPFFRRARQVLEGPRTAFFEELMSLLDSEQLNDLRNLAEGVAIEMEREELLSDLEEEDPNARRRWQELHDLPNPRENLHLKTLAQLVSSGYLVAADQPKNAQFMAEPFWLHVQDYFRTRRGRHEAEQPRDFVISLLQEQSDAAAPSGSERSGRGGSKPGAGSPPMIRTLFRSRGARIVTARKPLSDEIKQEFMDSLSRLINQQLDPKESVEEDDDRADTVFRNLEEVGKYILAQFTTEDIQNHLRTLPQGSTVLFVVDDALKDIPWELMLETAYAGEIPFGVGRTITATGTGKRVDQALSGRSRVKALLIGDPEGNLGYARSEVEGLADRLRRDPRFANPDVLVGPEQCRRIRLLNRLGSGEYGLVHYSGHTRFDGQQSAWQLKGEEITTDRLTSALQMAPPALVFSSSCESAKASASKAIRFENQTFDLPGAFLEAGVEAYIGTLWEVVDEAASQFVEEFYSAFLSAEYGLGECLRRAKWASKRGGRWRDRIHWLAYVLYGDPHTKPGDLYPVMGRAP